MSGSGQPEIAVALSGGVDSLFALLALKETGNRVMALHGRLIETSEFAKLAASLGQICQYLSVPFHIVDLREAFAEKVSRPFVEKCLTGETPNPCAACNRLIKFGLLFERAMGLGAEFFATGHYVKLHSNPYGKGRLFERAADLSKDQSYFLALVPRERMDKLLFPCSDLQKTTIREAVRKAGLTVPAASESQDICFTGKDWRNYVEDFLRRAGRPIRSSGRILLRHEDGSLRKAGLHSGLWRYTLGQRRGLGLPGPEPYYVIGKRAQTEELIIGGAKFLGMIGLRARELNFFVDPGLWPAKTYVKTRFRQPLLPARLVIEGDSLRVTLYEEAFPTACGQTLAVYDSSGFLLAGGVVSEIFQD